MKNFEYTIYIRTLGTAGEKYQALLNAIGKQTIRPQRVVVVIPYGYELPKERLGYEEFLRSDKGMVAQRIAGVSDCTTEYCLFLDDDLDFNSNFIETLSAPLLDGRADIVFPMLTEMLPTGSLVKILMAMMGAAIPLEGGKSYLKILRSGGFSYNPSHKFEDWYSAETGTGAYFCCRIDVMRNIHFEEELWLQNTAFPLPEDQVMYYKMVKRGYRILCTNDVRFIHLDAGGTSPGRREKAAFAMSCNKTIFWHRFIFKPDKNVFSRLLSVFCYVYYVLVNLIYSLAKALCSFNFKLLNASLNGYIQAMRYLGSEEYLRLPKI